MNAVPTKGHHAGASYRADHVLSWRQEVPKQVTRVPGSCPLSPLLTCQRSQGPALLRRLTDVPSTNPSQPSAHLLSLPGTEGRGSLDASTRGRWDVTFAGK